MMKGILSVVVTIGFFAVLILTGMGLISFSETNQFALMLIGSLAAAFGMVMTWHFGSSEGSFRKTELLANKPEAGFARVSMLVLLALTVLLACAGMSSPERTLARGYDTANTVVLSTTALLNLQKIRSDQAETVFRIGTATKNALDASTTELKRCRAREAEGVRDACKSTDAYIRMNSAVTLELERYLTELEAGK